MSHLHRLLLLLLLLLSSWWLFSKLLVSWNQLDFLQRRKTKAFFTFPVFQVCLEIKKKINQEFLFFFGTPWFQQCLAEFTAWFWCLGSCWTPGCTNGSYYPGSRIILPSSLFRIRDMDGFCTSSLPWTSYSTLLPLCVLRSDKNDIFPHQMQESYSLWEIFCLCKCVRVCVYHILYTSFNIINEISLCVCVCVSFPI